MNTIQILAIFDSTEGRVAQVETHNALGQAIVGVMSMAVLYALTGTDQIGLGATYRLG